MNEYLQRLRSIWAEDVLFGGKGLVEKGIDTLQLIHHPLRQSHPLIEVLSYLLIRRRGETPLPLSSEIKPLPLGELCQLALLRAIAGEEEESLACQILSFHPFTALGCPEKIYQEKEIESALALLFLSFGKEVPIPLEADLYFQALLSQLPKWEWKESSLLSFPASLHLGTAVSAALVALGVGVPLGGLCLSSEYNRAFPFRNNLSDAGVSIPAFGPQIHPLNDPHLFGVYRAISDSRYAAVSANREIWFETIPSFDKGELEIRFIGLPFEGALSFVYYIKADIAKIGQEAYMPRSLRRYSSSIKPISFTRKDSKLTIEAEGPLKMDLIPLAGEGCFWDSDFLLAFEVPPHDGRMVFRWMAS